MKMKKHAAGVLIGAALSTLSYQSYADVILHAFNWTYDDVAAKAQEIADLGYTKVL
ncbi:MAG TPA: alpha-amylase, partial [Alteromonas macleodii]|nr:alpha-amylase [Alteromonas macleodii]